MKTKSESNLAQRFDFVAVDIPLDGEPEQEKEKENETQTTEDKKDEPVKQDEAPPHSGQRGRRPSVFEEGLKEFYDSTTTGEKVEAKESKAPEITLEDLDAVSGQTTE